VTDTNLSEKQAFDSMYRFLESYWKRFADARLSDVLGDIQPAFLADTVTADPAAWEDWRKAVEEVIAADAGESERDRK
jgi:predicted secreted protein